MSSLTVGVVGGLGPETSAKFYAKVVGEIYKSTGRQPNIVIDSVPISAIELDVISKGSSVEVCRLLESSVRRLSDIPVDFIVIPCNTVHIYFDQMRKSAGVPILNIIDETAISAKNRGLKRVGVIATTTTVASGMYQKSLRTIGIQPMLPSIEDQKEITSIVVRILDGVATERDAGSLTRIVDRFGQRGADGVILGCTDLQLLIGQNEKIAVIDSMESLASATIKHIIEAEKNMAVC